MKTRQQRLAEGRAGHPPSPPQSLPMNQPGPRRARSKMANATVASGYIVPAPQSAALGKPQALLRIWMDVDPEHSGQPVNEPTHQVAFDSSLLPKVAEFLNNIRIPSNENPNLHQETQEREEVGEAVKPREPEFATACKPTKKRKNAFRRNPSMNLSGVEPLPLSASVDSAPTDVIPMIFRSDFNSAANTPSDEISQQPDEKLPANENHPMIDASESGSMIGPSAETSQSAGLQQSSLASHTPRGSKWGLGGMLESARSITSRLVLSSPVPVSESPEASPQTTPTSAPMIVTEAAAPPRPKKKSLAPTSASSKRAKGQLHDNLAGKSGSKSRKIERQRAKPAVEIEGEGAPAMQSTYPAKSEEEAQQAVIREPIANIRWPSRSLDRMNANKRKRWGDPIDTPGIDAKGHSRGATDIYVGPEQGSTTEEQPVKRRRTDQFEGLASQAIGNPSVPRPSAVSWQGGYIFAEDQAAREAGSMGQQFQPKTPIPSTSRTGTFKVPSPGDSDWSDSGSNEDEGDNASLEGIAPSRANNGGPVVVGPSKPRQTLRPSESETLRKAREKSQKYKPRKPSRLRHTIKAYPSPTGASERQSEPSGGTRLTTFEDWCRMAPPAAVAAVKQMEVDFKMAGNVVEAALLEDPGPGQAFQPTAYEDWYQTASSAVTAILDRMEVDDNMTGQAFVSGLDIFVGQN